VGREGGRSDDQARSVPPLAKEAQAKDHCNVGGRGVWLICVIKRTYDQLFQIQLRSSFFWQATKHFVFLEAFEEVKVAHVQMVRRKNIQGKDPKHLRIGGESLGGSQRWICLCGGCCVAAVRLDCWCRVGVVAT